MASTGTHYVLYHYNPSTAAAATFVALFALTTLLHITQLLQKRTWYFIPFVIGGLFETIGYVGRIISSQQSPNWTTGPYIIQSLLILLAPALFAASIYMILARIIRIVDGEEHSLIRTKWLTTCFVSGDVLSFLAQSAGGGMLAKAKDASGVKLGHNIIVGGLGIQLIFFGFFITVAGLFHYRISIFPTPNSHTLKTSWQSYLVVLYAVSALIILRSSFRIVEYAMSSDGPLLRNEIYLYIFDAVLMFFAMVVLNIWHPSKITPSRQSKSGGEIHEVELGGMS